MVKVNRLGHILLAFTIFAFSFAFPSLHADAAPKKKRASVSLKKKSKKSKRSRVRVTTRKSNPVQGKILALDMIRSNSEEVARLAGIEPNADLTENDHAIAGRKITNLPTEGENLEELEIEDDVQVDMDSFHQLFMAYVGDEEDGDIFTPGGLSKKDIMDQVMDWLGTHYHFGGMSRSGIDCSAFTQTVFRNGAKVELPRTAAMQYEEGKTIKRENLEFGDLVFFHTLKHTYVSHVGIYLGDNLFAHASSRYGVTVSSLESTYYGSRFIGARRFSATKSRISSNDIDVESNRN
ncbi:MAG TPA: NlpC/P60 family protein [Patescibacteria group bacterium]|nr:NlpC/P60 family protein [Patescibacteria group bacterium]